MEETYIEDDFDDSDELKDRGFNRLLDEYLVSASMSEEDYHSLTPKQRDVIQCLKRAFKRQHN